MIRQMMRTVIRRTTHPATEGSRGARPPIAAVALAGALTAGAAALAPAPAAAQFAIHPAACADRAKMVEKLLKDYGEVRRGAGLQSAQGVVELYVSRGGSWTLLLTLSNGKSCPVAVGEAWHEDKESVKQLDQDA